MTPGICLLLFIAIITVLTIAQCDAKGAENISTERLIYGIWLVESGGSANPKDGDGGKAIGPFQIWKVYWQDAIEHRPDIGGSYEDCRDIVYARRIVYAYFDRWASGQTVENKGRCHNRGCNKSRWHGKAGDDYWARILKALREVAR